MQNKFASWMLLCVGALLFAATGQTVQARTAGRIIAAKVHGTVTAIQKSDNARKELHDGNEVSEGYVISTAAKSSVVLLFANGAAVNLAGDSTLSIDEFLMDPFDPKYSVAEAKEEPSTSVTKLSLDRGEFVGNVKHLRRENGSTFTINTPVGAAGIRGTTFQFTIGVDSAGKPFVNFGTAEGLVSLTSLDGIERLIPAGKTVNITFETTTTATGEVAVVPGSVKVSGVEDMPATQQAAIAKAVEVILTTQSNPTTPAPAPTATKPPVETTPGDGKG
jgi:hypothetical protein